MTKPGFLSKEYLRLLWPTIEERKAKCDHIQGKGASAALRNEPRESNPYPPKDDIEYQAWNTGWEKANKEKCK